MAHFGTQTLSKLAKMKSTTADPYLDTAPASSSLENASGGSQDEETPYIKELQKNIRNLNKKIANASKTDAILEEHSDKSLDDLVASKLINNDQKAMILKKPGLQRQVTQLEEQLHQFRKVDQEYRSRAAKEKADLEKALTEQSEADKAAALVEVRQTAEAEHNEGLSEKFLILSQFLRLAAARRTEDADPALDENLALEGVLLAIYTGDEAAVSTMTKLVQGTDETTTSVSGEPLSTTYGQVKAAAQAYKTPLFAGEDGTEPQEADSEPKASPGPTLMQPGASQFALGEDIPLANGHVVENDVSTKNVELDSSVATITIDSQFDTGHDTNMSISQEWVSVPRDATDAEPMAPPVTIPFTPSWADDQPDPRAEAVPLDSSDGFHQVQRNRGRGDGWRSRGRGDGRGRSHYHNRGEHRGGNRGSRGTPGGRPRRSDEW